MLGKKDSGCPYAIMVYGVPICSLNVCPCEHVDDRLCERIYTTLMPEGKGGIAGEEEDTDEYI